jgi:hypothetical protein
LFSSPYTTSIEQSGFINSIECADVVNNTQITVKTVMRLIKDKMTEQGNDEFATELFNDSNQPNGNKLRTYITLYCLVPHIPLP